MKRLLEQHLEDPSRRLFLQVAAIAGGGFAIGFAPRLEGAEASVEARFAPNPFVRIHADNTVTVLAKHLEMGQGSHTGLATLVAEELDADWAQIRVEGAPADPKLYNNLSWGPMQGTGGSSSVANSWEQLRKAGAGARAMLVAAAAEEWGVPAEEVRVHLGIVEHAPTRRSATFGQLATSAAKRTPPTTVKLKDPKDFQYIGKHVPRKDGRAKVDGSATFTQDVKLPGMLTVVVARPDRFGGKVKSFDATKAKAVPGVVDVLQIPSGIAVLGKDFWAAKKGRDALKVEWDDSSAQKLGTPELLKQYQTLLEKPGAVARKDGDAEAALGAAAKRLQADFEFPFLAHAPMEPVDCVVRLVGSACEVWTGAQFQTMDQVNVATVLGLKPEQVDIHMLFAGGSFGRRANTASDFLVEAAQIVKAIRGRAPVKLVWTREDDLRGGYYRPMYVHRLHAGLDGSGRLVGWTHRIVGQSIATGTPMEGMMVKDGVDHTSVEGASSLPYAIPNLRVDLHSPKSAIPVLWWRAVGSTHTAFSTETFLDEVAAAAGRAPVELRRELLAKHPRHLRTLNLAVEKSDWGKPMAKGKGRGVAIHECFNTVVAQVAEVSLTPGGFKVDRVVCAVDCGVAVNPDVIRAQMEGGIGFGLSAALHSAITLKDGRVQQSNFHQYRQLRIGEMPEVAVHIVPSAEPPTGVGEPGVPPIAPAVANALFAATGRRLRNLPLKV